MHASPTRHVTSNKWVTRNQVTQPHMLSWHGSNCGHVQRQRSPSTAPASYTAAHVHDTLRAEYAQQGLGKCRTSNCPSVRPSVCLSVPSAARRSAGLLLWARRAEDIDRLLHGGAQQQPRRSSGIAAGERGQCRVVSGRMKLSTDLFHCRPCEHFIIAIVIINHRAILNISLPCSS